MSVYLLNYTKKKALLHLLGTVRRIGVYNTSEQIHFVNESMRQGEWEHHG